MKYTVVIILFIFSQTLFAAKNDTARATYIGGEKALAKYIKANLKGLKNMRAGVEGCNIQTTVSLNEKNKIVDVKSNPQTGTCSKDLTEELISLLKKSSNWKSKTFAGKAFYSEIVYTIDCRRDSVVVHELSQNEIHEITTVSYKSGYGEDVFVAPPPVKVSESSIPSDLEIYTIVEETAEFPGGVVELRNFMDKNIIYPKEARENNISGKCFLKFVVTSTGKIEKIEVLKGVAGCKECDLEAVRVIKMSPDWKPAKMQGQPVNVYYNLPVNFRPKQE
jgi:protein TonB